MNEFIPNSFQVPNAFVDLIMRGISGNAVKCYLLIIRKTAGWHKLSDCISITQFMAFCGIKKDETAQKAVEELAQFGLIRADKQQGKITRFFLNTLPEQIGELPPKNGGTTTPKNGVHPKNGTTPENGDWVHPKNGGTTTPKNGGSTKDNTKNTITKNKINITQPEKTEHKKSTHQTDLQTLQDMGVDKQIAQDWLQTRKEKRAGSLTQTVVTALQREAAKAGLTVPQAVQVAAERNWARFVASYLHNEQQGFSGSLKPQGNRITQTHKHGEEAKSGLARDVLKGIL
ncbi:replication protein [Wielerella bovis]|uniref:replication protein n=1 Tax=Wielerella bovis TaxID=2917790 RepID=UPI002018A6E6|nr:replication protein [Wielerella bovis]ULJ64035.1 replication protein [Wielerella bovis]